MIASLRSEAKDLIEKEFQLGVLKKVLGIVALGQLFNSPAQGCIDLTFIVICFLAILVECMGGNTVFIDVVHFPGANLQFDALFAGTNNRCVNGFVTVLLRGRNKVLEATGYNGPGCVCDAKSAVTLLNRIDDDTKAENI